MSIFRKFKTACSVLRQYGAREAFGLLRDNAAKAIFGFRRILGRIWRKTADSLILRLQHKGHGQLHILYITTAFEAFHSQTVRYRIHNMRQALRGKAKTRFEVLEDGVYNNSLIIGWADVVILMRVTRTDMSDRVIEKAEQLKVPVIFDIDDIIFLTDYAESYCRVLGDTSTENIKLRSSEFEGFEKTFRKCEYATASTPFIAERMIQEGKKAYVIHNGLNRKQISIANSVKNSQGKSRNIGYASGTKTHDRDFSHAISALERIAKEYDDVKLRVAGYLDLNALPPALKKRVEPACYMSWQRLMKYGAGNYINIAPLDVENPFCHAKSELKYFEAAAVGVPTVASPTDTFTRCIKNGENGMLASTEEEWYTAIKSLLDDHRLYLEVSQRAREHALNAYSPAATAQEALSAYTAVAAAYKSEISGDGNEV